MMRAVRRVGEHRTGSHSQASAVRTGWGILRSAPAVLPAAGVLLVLAGFFLPWAVGDSVFEGRRLSGMDLALLLRRFDLAVGSWSAVLAALALYSVPAVAVGSLLMQLGARSGSGLGRGVRRWLLLAALYPLLVVIAVTVFLWLHPLEVMARGLRLGLPITLAGSVVWLAGVAFFPSR